MPLLDPWQVFSTYYPPQSRNDGNKVLASRFLPFSNFARLFLEKSPGRPLPLTAPSLPPLAI